MAAAALKEAVVARGSTVALEHAIQERQRLALTPAELLAWVAERPGDPAAAIPPAWAPLEVYLLALQGDCAKAAAKLRALGPATALPTHALLPVARAELACQRSDAAIELLHAALRRAPYDIDAADLLIRQLRLRPNTADEIRRITRRVRGLHPQALAGP